MRVAVVEDRHYPRPAFRFLAGRGDPLDEFGRPSWVRRPGKTLECRRPLGRPYDGRPFAGLRAPDQVEKDRGYLGRRSGTQQSNREAGIRRPGVDCVGGILRLHAVAHLRDLRGFRETPE
ncbi:hypothetical protein GCM10011521_00360 [Arenimonas soli]|uniref:Uncharacterized protein n=1 Tax=Arenimonas soli TaxID=2269504 RepID=A0ABQ1H925_9GAMM|nr:hypothetical protein GCM10011521_00360 [Arenimonas soli]